MSSGPTVAQIPSTTQIDRSVVTLPTFPQGQAADSVEEVEATTKLRVLLPTGVTVDPVGGIRYSASPGLGGAAVAYIAVTTLGDSFLVTEQVDSPGARGVADLDALAALYPGTPRPMLAGSFPSVLLDDGVHTSVVFLVGRVFVTLQFGDVTRLREQAVTIAESYAAEAGASPLLKG